MSFAKMLTTRLILRGLDKLDKCSAILGSIVYSRPIEYKQNNFLKVVVHVIIIDQCN